MSDKTRKHKQRYVSSNRVNIMKHMRRLLSNVGSNKVISLNSNHNKCINNSNDDNNCGRNNVIDTLALKYQRIILRVKTLTMNGRHTVNEQNWRYLMKWIDYNEGFCQSM